MKNIIFKFKSFKIIFEVLFILKVFLKNNYKIY